MRHSITIAAVVFFGFVPLGSLTAQPVTYYPDANWDLPPDGVLAIVRSNGLEPRSQPQRQGGAYALRVLDPAHQQVQATVDARSGRILRLEGADIKRTIPTPSARLVRMSLRLPSSSLIPQAVRSPPSR